MGKNYLQQSQLSEYFYARKHFSCVRVLSFLSNKIKKVYYNTPIYDFIEYDEYIPNNLNITPKELIPGDPLVGKQIANGTINIGKQSLDISANIKWRSDDVDIFFLEQLHSFDFLKDLYAVNRNQGRSAALRLIRSWMDEESFVDSKFWRSGILSKRLVNFITYANWLFKECDASFKKDLMSVILKQSKHLSKTIPWHKNSYEIIAGIKGVIYSGLALPQNQSAFLEGIDILKDELNKQILEDSTHFQKNPTIQYELLKDLLEIKSTMDIANQPVPSVITDLISSMAEVLAFFRHPDGSLALFNNSTQIKSEDLSLLLKTCNQSYQTNFLPRAGFRKVIAKDTCMILDCGNFAEPQILNSGTASTMSFELSYKNMRIFVNSGFGFRKSADFNTIEVDKNSNSAILNQGLTGHVVDKVESFLQEEKTLGWGFEGKYKGFKNNSVKHNRRIFLSKNGDEIRGEDSVIGAKEQVKAFFHLHPLYKFEIENSHQANVLFDGIKIAELKIAGGLIKQHESLFCETLGESKSKHTLTVSAKAKQKETLIRWAISFTD